LAIWNGYSTGRLLRVLTGHENGIRDCAWSANGQQILSVSYDCSARQWDTEKAKLIMRRNFDRSVLTALERYNDFECFVGTRDNVYKWDNRCSSSDNKDIVQKYHLQYGLVQSICCLNEYELVISGDVVSKTNGDYSITAWDIRQGAILSNQIYNEPFISTCLKKHPYKETFYAQTHGNYICEFSSQRPYKLNKYKRYQSHLVNAYAVGLDISPDGQYLVSGSSNGYLHIYNCQTTKKYLQLGIFRSILNQPLMDVKFHPVIKNCLALSCWNGNVHIYS